MSLKFHILYKKESPFEKIYLNYTYSVLKYCDIHKSSDNNVYYYYRDISSIIEKNCTGFGKFPEFRIYCVRMSTQVTS